MSNTIIILGYVGKAPEQVTLNDATKALVKFRVAVKEPSVKGQEKTQWYTVEAWNGTSENTLKYITKGREVQVTGRLSLVTYTAKDGSTQTDPVIKMSNFHLCGKKPEASSTDSQ
jgi:single-strand DNA-binding protein